MGPDETLTTLMAEHGDRLLRLAFQLTHDRSSAQDVVQEALVSMYRSWRRRQPSVEAMLPYARRAVLNEFLRRQRRLAASEVVTSAVPELPVAAFDDAVLDRDEVWRCLGELPARQRAVLVLRFYEELPDTRIAELIGVRPATVRSLALRGLAALRVSSLAADGA